MTAIPFIYYANIPKIIARMLRVDHAGETAATIIYGVQHRLARILFPDFAASVADMLADEKPHLDFFEQHIALLHSRPTMLLPIWHLLSWLLGGAFGAFGRGGIEWCSLAVEEVIVEHYQGQQKVLAHLESLLGINLYFGANQDAKHSFGKANSVAAQFEADTESAAQVRAESIFEPAANRATRRQWDSDYSAYAERHLSYGWRKNFARGRGENEPSGGAEQERVKENNLAEYIAMLKRNIEKFTQDERAHLEAAQHYVELANKRNIIRERFMPQAACAMINSECAGAGDAGFRGGYTASGVVIKAVQLAIKSAIMISAKL